MMIGHQSYRALLVFFGLALTLFGVWDLLVPRARFVNSNPPAGADIADVPPAVIVSFSNRLGPDSRLDVSSTVKLLPSGEPEYLDGRSVIIKSEIDPADSSCKSLRANLRPGLHKGLYWVSWTTKTAGWRTVSYGKTAFGVGMKVPDHLTKDMGGAVWERRYQHRSRRATLVGGVVLLALGLFLTVGKR